MARLEPRFDRYPYDSPLLHPRAAQGVTALAPVPSRNDGSQRVRTKRCIRRWAWRRKTAAALP